MDKSENLEPSDSSEPCKLAKVIPSPLSGDKSLFLLTYLIMTSLEASVLFCKIKTVLLKIFGYSSVSPGKYPGSDLSPA